MQTPYDLVATAYSRHRRPDPRIAAAIMEALGRAGTVANVGAGTGSYEPSDRCVVAAELSSAMISARGPHLAPVVRARAEQLPFATGAVDAALAVLTLHHWIDPARGLAEMRRVARARVVLLTWDPEAEPFWLVRDYVPAVVAEDRRIFPTMKVIAGVLGPVEVRPVPIPFDCADGFLGAYWRRPHAYLDREVQDCISTFAKVPDLSRGLQRLERELESGHWARRNADLIHREDLDVGYRLIVATLDQGLQA